MTTPAIQLSGEPLLEAATLDSALAIASRSNPQAAVHYPGTAEKLTCAELDRAATRCANALRRQGVGRGQLVGIVHGTGPGLLPRLFGVLRTGAAASVLPSPHGLAGVRSVVGRIGRIINSAGIRCLLIDSRYDLMGEELRRHDPGLAVPSLDTVMVGADAELPVTVPEDLAIVQFTSGSTSDPKGVMLTHRNVLAGLRSIVVSAAMTPADVLVQWIPLYHDMGLFGLLGRLLNGGSSHVLDPMAFLRDPSGFPRVLADHQATLTTGPNFGYELMSAAGSASQNGDPADLHRMRIAFNGAEPVLPATVAAFQEALQPTGLSPAVMFPCYGMAEATLAVTFPPVGRRPSVVHFDRPALAGLGLARPVPDGGTDVVSLVSVGSPVQGMSLRIVDEAGHPVSDGRLGEIQICGNAVFTGYYRDPAATAQAFRESWFRTEDLGFTLDGELFIAGRRKEMIIVRGQNYFPADAEAVIRDVPGIYRHRCVAFPDTDDDGAESMGVVAETKLPEPSHPALADDIRRRITAELGLSAIVVYLRRPRYLTQTTSGKWQRLLTRDRIHAQSA